MKEIMKIKDIFQLPKHGFIVVGKNDNFKNLTPNDIRNLIGKRILICSPDGNENKYDVSGIDVPISMQGEICSINIGIGQNIGEGEIERNSMVYAINGNE